MMRASRRHGAANQMLVWLLVSAIVLGTLVALLVWKPRHRPKSGQVDELFVYCAAGMRYPMDEIVKQYEQEYGVHVDLQYGGSNTLLSQLQVSKTGDLYLAADDSYIKMARQKGLAAEVIPLAVMRPVVALRKDSKIEIGSMEDLLTPTRRIACGNPDAAAIGRVVRRLLTKTGHWDALRKLVTEKGVFKPTVNDVANDVKLGSVDAGIVWDATAAQYPDLRIVRLPELDQGVSNVEITVLNSSKDPTAALRFARYVGARDKGLVAFKEKKFPVVDGDAWTEHPELTFFAGSVNRRALAPIIKAFEQREGATVNTVYNGCGILTGQMKAMKRDQASGFPDTYMACDVYYMNTVKDWFEDRVEVSDTDIVIAVVKGNPKGIHGLNDLLKPGIRVVIGQPDQCTIGVLTRRLLESVGVYDKLIKGNVVSQTSSSAMLVPAITTNSADAVLAYRTDTRAEKDKVDVIPVKSDLAKAIQPFGVAKSSQHKYLGRRLFETIARSRDAFESVGFRWRLRVKPDMKVRLDTEKDTETGPEKAAASSAKREPVASGEGTDAAAKKATAGAGSKPAGPARSSSKPGEKKKAQATKNDGSATPKKTAAAKKTPPETDAGKQPPASATKDKAPTKSAAPPKAASPDTESKN